MSILDQLLPDYQVIHISGQLDWETVKDHAARLSTDSTNRYRPFPYLHERMGIALAAADLVVSRAGAATLGEFPALGVPAVLVPYPHAWRYQKVNADYLAAAGAALRLDDQDMASQLLPTIQRLLGDRDTLEKMSTASRSLDRPGAAQRVVDLLADLAARGDR
jgi:UDP-N-acetylglucosamine--N-acetylmuramyl-(pentapeptide) pyrophosphoryl-undecaprenol N-acetylglucosamine transferase